MAIPVRRRDRVTHLGSANDDTLEEQTELRFSVGEDGMWTITQTYVCDFDSVLRLCPKPYSQNKVFPFALMVGAEGEREDAGRCRLVCTFKGLTADFRQPGSSNYTFGPGESAELIATTSEEPIETHPKYSGLSAEDLAAVRKYCDNPTGSAPLGDNETAQKLIEKKLKGIESYLAPALTYRITYPSSIPVASVAGVGKIDTPPGAPTLTGDQNWIFLGATSRRQGGAYETSREWRASGLGGWDVDLYGNAPSA